MSTIDVLTVASALTFVNDGRGACMGYRIIFLSFE